MAVNRLHLKLEEITKILKQIYQGAAEDCTTAKDCQCKELARLIEKQTDLEYLRSHETHT